MTDPCPNCGKALVRHSHAAGPAGDPEVGDVSLCENCLAFSVFDENDGVLYRRRPSNAEWQEILGDTAVMQVFAMVSARHPVRHPAREEQSSSSS